MWTRTIDGRPLHFYLAGINDQNFLMRDRETGSWWQQINGRAIAGRLRGAQLRLLSSEEISFGLWRREYPLGTVLAPIASDARHYAHAGWQKRYTRLPVVVPVPGNGLKPRALVVGITWHGDAMAFPDQELQKNKLIEARLDGQPLLVALGPDGRTVRVFWRRFPGAGQRTPHFYLPVRQAASLPQKNNQSRKKPASAATKNSRSKPHAKPQLKPVAQPQTQLMKPEPPQGKAKHHAPLKAKKPAAAPWRMIDDLDAGQWNFRGCAVSGPTRGQCLQLLPSINEDWFDWLHYHPRTQIEHF